MRPVWQCLFLFFFLLIVYLNFDLLNILRLFLLFLCLNIWLLHYVWLSTLVVRSTRIQLLLGTNSAIFSLALSLAFLGEGSPWTFHFWLSVTGLMMRFMVSIAIFIHLFCIWETARKLRFFAHEHLAWVLNRIFSHFLSTLRSFTVIGRRLHWHANIHVITRKLGHLAWITVCVASWLFLLFRPWPFRLDWSTINLATIVDVHALHWVEFDLLDKGSLRSHVCFGAKTVFFASAHQAHIHILLFLLLLRLN